MTDRLFAFFTEPGGAHPAGVFERDSAGRITFSYFDADDSGTPLSLSLPRGESHHSQAPHNYLENLLPDRQEVKQRWAREARVDHRDVMSMLAAHGEDVAGAVTLTENEDLPQREPQALYEAEAGSIAARISSLRHDATSWVDPRAKPRMSLAGQQGKFSVAHIRGRWFWPTYETPSTHIIKPAAHVHELLDDNEAGALKMARSIGISASEAEVLKIEDQRAFMTKRWDRTEDGFRVHAEDMVQAHGVGTDDKYRITAPQVARKLRQHGADARPFVEQLAFNTYLWNADAHGKNYSALLDAGNVELAPMYDAVPTRVYPDYDEALAMPIGRTASPSLVEAASWRKFAVEAGLGEDEVVHIAFTIRNALAERYESFISALPKDPASKRNLQRHVKRLRQQMRNEP